jgi:hypothetical protein
LKDLKTLKPKKIYPQVLNLEIIEEYDAGNGSKGKILHLFLPNIHLNELN